MPKSATIASRIRRLADFAGRYAHAAALVAQTFSIGLLSRRRRHLIARLAREANYPRPPATLLPSVAIASITSERTQVVLPHPEAVEGNVSVLELVVLARLVRERAPSAVFEIGTFNGRTTVTLAANAPDGATVYTLDLPADHPTRFPLSPDDRRYVDKPASGELLRDSRHGAKARQLFGDSATFDFSPYAADFVFVDGSHAYDYVTSDSLRALSMLRDGRGLLVWHDYGEWDGVTRALNDLFSRNPRFRGLRHVAGTSLAILELAVSS